jgi:large repetitive protein
MKTIVKLLKLLVLLVLLAHTGTVWAQQPYPFQGNDTVCLNATAHYGVVNTPGSTYTWSITPPVGGTITGNGNNTISVLWQTVGVYVLEVIETNQYNCPGIQVSIQVQVNDLPLVDPVLASVCSGSAIGVVLPTLSTNGLTIDKWDITAVVDPSLTGIASTGNGIVNPNFIAADAFVNLTGTPLQVVYTVTPYAAGCAGPPFTITVTINPEPVVAPMTASVCSDVPIGVVLPTASTNSLAIDSWDITALVDPGLTGTASTGNGVVNPNFIAADVFTNITGGPLDVVYTVTPYTGTCAGDPFTITVTINPEPVVANMTAAVCSNVPIGVVLPTASTNGLVIGSWDITAVVDPGLTGTASTGNGIINPNFIAADVFVNTTLVPLTVVYTVIPYTGTCAGDPFTITVTINPEPVVAPMTASVCSDVPIGVVLPTLSSNGVVLDSWDITAVVDPGLTGTASTGNGVINPNFIAADVFTNITGGPLDVVYTVVPYGGTCAGQPFTITVTITPEPVVAPMTASVCSDVPIGVVLPTAGTNGLAIGSWDITAVVDPGLTGTASTGNGVVNPNFIAADVFTNITGGPLDVVYTVTPYTGTCAGDPFTITVTINPEPVVADMTAAVCSNVPIGVVLPTASTNGLAVDSWDITAVVDPGLTGTASTGNGIINPNFIAADVFVNTTNGPLTVVYTVTPYTGTCVGTPFTITVTINTEPVVANMTDAVCSNVAIGVVLPTASSNGQVVDSWDITAVVDPGLTGTASTGNGIINPNFIAGDIFVNTTGVPLTVTYTVTPYSGTCVGTPFTITVTINPQPVVANMTADVCSGEPISVGLPTISTNGLTVDSWDITAVVDPGLVVTTLTTGLVTDPNAIFNDVFVNNTAAPLDVTYTITPSAGPCVGQPFTITVTIEPALTTSPIYHD